MAAFTRFSIGARQSKQLNGNARVVVAQFVPVGIKLGRLSFWALNNFAPLGEKHMNITKPATFLALAVCLSGCAVQPWERGILARPEMALDPHPMQSALRSHNYMSREAASGGGSTSGGGCGCY